jgi:chromosome segregation ATPase
MSTDRGPEIQQRLEEMHQHLGSEPGKMTTLYGETTLLETSLLLRDAAAEIQRLTGELQSTRSELEAIAAIVSDRSEAGTYVKVDALEQELAQATKELREQDVEADRLTRELLQAQGELAHIKAALAAPGDETPP